MFAKMNHSRGITFCTLCMMGAVPIAQADDVWPGNGHFYRVVLVPAHSGESGIRWGPAAAAAAAAGGYLATCTSAEENDFVFGLAADPSYWVLSGTGHYGPWLGGWQADQTAGPAEGWTWINGETWAFSAWGPDQPNDSQGKPENALHYFYTDAQGRAPAWNDAVGLGDTDRQVYLASFVVEFDSQPAISPWMKSTFETGGDGWATCGDARLLQWQAPTPTARGCVYLTDLQDGRGALFVAPIQYLGNKAGAYGGAFSFDLRTTEGVDLHPRWDVLLSSSERSLFFDLPDPKVNVWTPRLARLTAEAGWHLDTPGGELATKADLLAVLGDLRAIVINGEFHYGSDKTLIDNVVLSIREDFDRDGDVDADDLGLFRGCASGPAVAHQETETCRDADLDDDGDVDQEDFGLFQRCYSGENRPTQPACAGQ